MTYFQGLKNSLNPPKPLSDAVHHVESEEDFDNRVKNAGNKLVVVDFFAHWCVPCTKIAPHLERLANQFKSQIVVLKVDVDQESELAMGRYGVSSMPTFVFLKNGKPVEQFSGADAAKIDETIRKYK